MDVHFENYVKYITSLGCSTIRMMPLIPMGRGNQFCNDFLLSNMETFDFVYRLSALKEEYPMVNFEWGDPLEHLFIVLLSKRKYPIVMNISSIGDLTITPYIPIVVGNIDNMRLIDYWKLGYNRIWGNKDVLTTIRKVKSIYDLSAFEQDSIRIEMI